MTRVAASWIGHQSVLAEILTVTTHSADAVRLLFGSAFVLPSDATNNTTRQCAERSGSVEWTESVVWFETDAQATEARRIARAHNLIVALRAIFETGAHGWDAQRKAAVLVAARAAIARAQTGTLGRRRVGAEHVGAAVVVVGARALRVGTTSAPKRARQRVAKQTVVCVSDRWRCAVCHELAISHLELSRRTYIDVQYDKGVRGVVGERAIAVRVDRQRRAVVEDALCRLIGKHIARRRVNDQRGGVVVRHAELVRASRQEDRALNHQAKVCVERQRLLLAREWAIVGEVAQPDSVRQSGVVVDLANVLDKRRVATAHRRRVERLESDVVARQRVLGDPPAVGTRADTLLLALRRAIDRTRALACAHRAADDRRVDAARRVDTRVGCAQVVVVALDLVTNTARVVNGTAAV